MSICDFIFVDHDSKDALGESFNVSNMLYLKVYKEKPQSNEYLLSVFFSSSAPPLLEHCIKESSLKSLLVDIVTKNKISLIKVSLADGLVFIPTGSVLYTRELKDEQNMLSGIVLKNSFVIKTSEKINKHSIGNMVFDYLSVVNII